MESRGYAGGGACGICGRGLLDHVGGVGTGAEGGVGTQQAGDGGRVVAGEVGGDVAALHAQQPSRSLIRTGKQEVDIRYIHTHTHQYIHSSLSGSSVLGNRK